MSTTFAGEQNRRSLKLRFDISGKAKWDNYLMAKLDVLAKLSNKLWSQGK
jgi:hypothetical protein